MIPGYRTRRSALLALLEFDRSGLPVAETLATSRFDDDRDHSLALEIATTTIRWLRLLDHHVDPFLRSDTSPELRWILRLSVAQVHFLSRIPIHAAVDLGVELAREAGGKGTANFANAVLRRAAHNPVRRPEGLDAESLAVRHSHPTWLVERWLARHGMETTTAMLRAGNEEPRLWVRARRGLADVPWSEENVVDRAHDGMFVRLDLPREGILSADAFRRGEIGLQDPSSGEAALLLAGHLGPGDILVDLCSAPGGKIACLRDSGALDGVRCLALDLSAHRQARTLDGFSRRGIEALVGVADGLVPPLRDGTIDAILLDAPCSNLGVISRRPEARWRARPGDPAGHAKLQSTLLETAVRLLKPGGVVSYSVCSTEPEECEGVLEKAGGGFETLSTSLRLPGQGGWDGFYSALLRKTA